jgi:2-polyprenyl-3-methyl-5-hydroxy-6-metoxy-1,4-benzoquinol methylase
MRIAREEAARRSGGTSDISIYRTVLRVAGELRAAGRALDFGAGTGTLARQLAELEGMTEIVAADLVAYPGRAEHPRITWCSCDLNGRLPLPDRAFDLVLAVEIIEHLENPRAVARELARLLRSGGVLILTTPNNESWRSLLSLILRGHYAAFANENYPAHISPLLRTDLRRILLEVGFEEPEFSFTDNGSIPHFTSVTWQAVSVGKLRGVRFSDNVVCAAKRGIGC